MELNILWKTLGQHEVYSKAFPSAGDDAAAILAMALPRFFIETPNANVLYKPEIVRQKLAGRYIMYRPETDEGHKTGLVMRSLVEVRINTTGPCVFETQRSPEGSIRGHNQNDVGFLFTFGDRIFFLIKQENGGTCVKFFIITKFDPFDDTRSVDTFRGLFSLSSHHGEFGLRKFFCKRLDDGDEIDYSSTEFTNIAARPGMRFIEDDVKNEMAVKNNK